MIAPSATKPYLNGHSHDVDVRVYLESLKAGEKPAIRPDCGQWIQVVESAEDAYDRAKHKGSIVQALLQSLIKSKKYPGLKELLSGMDNSRAGELDPHQAPALAGGYPALPESARLPAELATGACQWLDQYIEYSRQVSPEGYEDFHEACGLWILSTVAGRRIKIPFTKKQYTPLMILLISDTSLYAKSETADVGVMVLQAAGLRWLLGADRTTPQKLLTDMVGLLPKNYEQMDEEKQFWTRQKLSMSAQRGWRYDEFGELVRAISRSGGIMEDFKGLLLQLDACQDQYEYATQSRGSELIEKPYLSLLGCLTPPDLRNSAKSGSAFWVDGLWARFAPICPPPDTGIDAPFSLGELPVPYNLYKPLQNWHDRLGTPIVDIVPTLDKKERITGYEVTRTKLPEIVCSFGPGVYDAWVRYRSALKKIATEGNYRDFRGSYARLPIKAIRKAALFASLENNNQIEMRHWAKAQEIAERWRKSLHELYSQVNNSELETTYAKRIENDILKYVKKLEEKQPPTVRDLSRYLTQVDVGRIKESVSDMVRSNMLKEDKTGRSPRYTSVQEGE
jgi:hypothetical protein